jgi:hypothetical protein
MGGQSWERGRAEGGGGLVGRASYLLAVCIQHLLELSGLLDLEKHLIAIRP